MSSFSARLRRAILPLAGAATVLLSSGLTAAQPAPPPPAAPPAAAAPVPPLIDVLSGEAKADYISGRILYNNEDYANAILKFERAYELSREPRLLWNIALCQKNLKRYTRMLATVEKLLEDAGPQLSAEDKKDAEDLIQAIQAYVTRVTVKVDEPGAAVFIDDVQVGVSPLDKPVLVDVGRRKIRVTRPGFKESTVDRDIVGGGELTINVALEREIHRGRLIVKAAPDALISIDGRMVGRGAFDGPLQSGGHTLRVTAPGMQAYQSEVLIQDDQTRRVGVTLTERPSEGSSLKTWLWIGGGAAVLAGAIVTGALLFQPEEPTQGNVSPGTVQVAGARGFTLRFGGGR